jgi:fatty acid desaturase
MRTLKTDRHASMKRTAQLHKFALPINVAIRPLYKLDNWHAPLVLAADFAIIALAILATRTVGWILYPLAIIVIGSRQRALATMVHEASHSTLTRSKGLARILATFFSGYLVLSTFYAYKASHVASHHGHFGDSERDPDYRYMLQKGVYDIQTKRKLIWEFFIKPCLLGNVPSYLSYLLRARTFTVEKGEGRWESLWLGAYWAAIVGGSLAFGQVMNLLLFWIVPLFTTFQVIGWFIELAEHAPLMHNRSELHMTRNRNSHWLELFLTGMHGENYHLAHHLRPRIPFWNMKAVHSLLLRDPDYRRWDSQCGGIFVSSNGAPSVLSLLLQRCVSTHSIRLSA